MGLNRHPFLSLVTAIFMIFGFTLTARAEAKDFVVVLDAGHGGSDIGAPGPNSREKDINKAVTDKVGSLLKEKRKNVKIVYTRSRDRFVSLRDRCRIANNEGADLFVSIHCDASDANPSAFGSTVFIPQHKRSLDTVTGRSSGVIESEDDNSANPVYLDSSDPAVKFILDESLRAAKLISKELVNTAGRDSRGVQRRDFFVLEFTTMPAVLIELDFICNSEREAFLTSKEGQDRLAKAIVNALDTYIDKHATPPKKSNGKKKSPQPAADETIYKIQFLTSGRKLAETPANMKSLSPVEYYVENNTYKYTYGSTTSMSEAIKILKEVKTLFPDAFIIKFRNGERLK